MHYLTSLRGMAAILVVLFHTYHLVPEHSIAGTISSFLGNGYLAVDFFFVLSGFILAYKYQQVFTDGLVADYKAFVVKRIARVVPLHVFTMLLFLSIPAILLLTGRELSSEKYSISSFLAKLFLIDLWLNDGSWDSWNTPSWTISGEMLAYLLFPFIAFVFVRLNFLIRVLFGILAYSFLLFFFSRLEATSIGDHIGSLGGVRCLVEFLLGVLVFNVYQRVYGAWTSHIFSALLFVSLTALIFLSNTLVPNYVFIPLVFSSILLGLLGCYQWLKNMLEARLLVFLGEISYSVYLVHIFTREIFYKAFFENGSEIEWYHIQVFLLVTILLAWWSFKWIELPCRNFILNRFIR